MTYYETEHFSKPIFLASDGDEVIFRLKSQTENYKMSKYEFDWLCGEFYNNWQNNRGKYHEVLKMWNEDRMQDNTPTTIYNLADLIDSLNCIENSIPNALSKKSFNYLKVFFERNRQNEIEFFKN